MAGFNLVKLADQSYANNAYVTHTYSCDNFSEVIMHITKNGSGVVNLDDLFITIMAGTDVTVCNRIPISSLIAVGQYEGGTGQVATFGADNANGKAVFSIDTGCHWLDSGQEFFIAIENKSGAAGLDIVTSLKCNTPDVPSPKTYAYRTDNAFSLPLVETLYAVDVDGTANMDEEAGNVDISYGNETYVVPLKSASHLLASDSVGDQLDGISNLALIYDSIPRQMQVNCSVGSIAFLAVSTEIATPKMVQKARRIIPAKFSSLNRKERVVLAQGH